MLLSNFVTLSFFPEERSTQERIYFITQQKAQVTSNLMFDFIVDVMKVHGVAVVSGGFTTS